MSGNDRLFIAFPVADIDLANRAAELFDPDVGGINTLTIERQRGGYVWTETWVSEQSRPVVEGRNPQTWCAVLAQIADRRGLVPLTLAECEHLCAVAKVGDEFLADAPPPPEPSPVDDPDQLAPIDDPSNG